MEVDRISRELKGLGEVAMPDAGLEATRRVEAVCNVPPVAGVLQLLEPGVAAGGFFHHRSVAHRVKAMR